MTLSELEPGAIRLALRWLSTLTRMPRAIVWNEGQHAAACEALQAAEAAMAADVLTLAGMRPRVDVLAAIDKAEAETAAAIRAQDARTCKTCRYLDSCGMEQAPCNGCSIGQGSHGGWTSDRWQAAAAPSKYAEPSTPAAHGECLEAALRVASALECRTHGCRLQRDAGLSPCGEPCAPPVRQEGKRACGHPLGSTRWCPDCAIEYGRAAR